MEKTDEKLNTATSQSGLKELLARQLCAAYWRGRFDGYGMEGQSREGEIKARIDQTWKQWVTAAKSTLSMMEC